MYIIETDAVIAIKCFCGQPCDDDSCDRIDKEIIGFLRNTTDVNFDIDMCD